MQILDQAQQKKLIFIARKSIKEFVNTEKIPDFEEEDPVLNKPMGAFVTLTRKNTLRGCIGNIVSRQPLFLTVRDMAIAAATQDPRFISITREELESIHIEISVLSPPKKIKSADEVELGSHGVIVNSGTRSGVYLPQVAKETGWTKEEFLNSLCFHKAGLPADSWKKGNCELLIFDAQVFGE